MSPRSLDPQVVLRRLAWLDRALTQLEGHRDVEVETLAIDLDLQWSVLHGLQLASQAVLDVAAHIAVAAGDSFDDYTQIMSALARRGVIEPALAARLSGLAGFRNVVVHAYLDVDLAVVTAVLRDRLPDLRAFADAVRAWLAQRRE